MHGVSFQVDAADVRTDGSAELHGTARLPDGLPYSLSGTTVDLLRFTMAPGADRVTIELGHDPTVSLPTLEHGMFQVKNPGLAVSTEGLELTAIVTFDNAYPVGLAGSTARARATLASRPADVSWTVAGPFTLAPDGAVIELRNLSISSAGIAVEQAVLQPLAEGEVAAELRNPVFRDDGSFEADLPDGRVIRVFGSRADIRSE